MSAEVNDEIELELAHVLFIDIVGYSKRLINEQRALLNTLNQIVRSADKFREAEAGGRLKRIPTNDGLAPSPLTRATMFGSASLCCP